MICTKIFLWNFGKHDSYYQRKIKILQGSVVTQTVSGELTTYLQLQICYNVLLRLANKPCVKRT